jgi:hypothetical protein
MEQLDLDLLVRVSKRAILVVLTGFFMHETLAVFGLIPRRMI